MPLTDEHVLWLIRNGCLVPECEYGEKAHKLGLVHVPLCFGHGVELDNTGEDAFNLRHATDLRQIGAAYAEAWRQRTETAPE